MDKYSGKSVKKLAFGFGGEVIKLVGDITVFM